MHKLEKLFYCFDCDGVIWRGKEPIKEARNLLIKLKESGKCLRFITNTSLSTRAQHALKIKNILNLPFDIEEEEVITASYVTARYLNKNLKEKCSILVLGMEGIQLELESVGFKVTRTFENGNVYGAVVVGLDLNFNYNSVTEAIKVFQSNPDAKLIGCNLDANYVGAGGQVFPGTGSLVKCVAYATGKDPIIMGKPNNFIYSALLDSCPQFDPTRAVFIGDRLDSDIAFANANGIFSILVETGVHKRSDITKEFVPDQVVSDLNELLF